MADRRSSVRGPRAALLGVLVLLSTAACSGLPRDESRAHLRTAELGDMANVSVCGNVWLGGGASRADLGIAARRGVRTIVDLRSSLREADLDVEAIALGNGMTYVRADLDPAHPVDATVDRVIEAIESAGGEPVLLLSDNGNRSAAAFAIYRATHDGLPVDGALEEARRAGLKPGLAEAGVRRQVARLRALAEAQEG